MLITGYTEFEFSRANIRNLNMRVGVQLANRTFREPYFYDHKLIIVRHHLPLYTIPQIEPGNMLVYSKKIFHSHDMSLPKH